MLMSIRWAFNTVGLEWFPIQVQSVTDNPKARHFYCSKDAGIPASVRKTANRKGISAGGSLQRSCPESSTAEVR